MFYFPNCCHRISTHRLVVCAASLFLEAILCYKKEEEAVPVVSLFDISGPMLKNFIDFFYTGQFHIDAGNVYNVLDVADRWGTVELVEKCADYVRNNLSVESCLATWLSAKSSYKYLDIKGVSFNYICQHFGAVVETDKFLQLNSQQLLSILNDNAVAVNYEEEIFNAIVRWIDGDTENRRNDFEKLMSAIQMSQISEKVKYFKLFNSPNTIIPNVVFIRFSFWYRTC